MTSLADPRRFLYRDLDPEAAQRLAAETLRACDDGELFLQYVSSESFGFDDGRLKTADYNTAFKRKLCRCRSLVAYDCSTLVLLNKNQCQSHTYY